MAELSLSSEERSVLTETRWFSALSPSSRHDLLRHSELRRFAPGEVISFRGSNTCESYGCLSGAVRIGYTLETGRQLVLTFVRPGIWFGEPGLFDGGECTHDAHAHGETAIMAIAKPDFEAALASNPELCFSIMRLQARHIRELYGALEEVNTLSLGARLARKLQSLVQAHGVPASTEREGRRIDLDLVQEDLAQLVGSCRQRVNFELKHLERSGAIRIDREGLVVCNVNGLMEASAHTRKRRTRVPKTTASDRHQLNGIFRSN